MSSLASEAIVSQLEQSKHEWEVTFDAISDFIVIRDVERRVVKINRPFAEALRSTPRNIVGRILSGLENGNGRGVIESPEIDVEGMEPVTLSGSFMVSRSPIPDMTGRPEAEVRVLRDVTAMTQMEGNLRGIEKAATIQALAATVAHEISNPIAIISGRTSLLLDEPGLDPKVRSVLEIIQRQVGRVTDLTRTLSKLASPGTGKRTSANVEGVIDEALTLMGYEFSRNHIRLVRQFSALPDVQINPGQFVQVFINLFTNARDAMPQGGTLTVATSRVAQDAEHYLRVSVRDTGTGIEPQVAPKIFVPFFTTKPAGKGTGLGLAVSRSIVREHGGDIRVDSTPGSGTTFQIDLPLGFPRY